MGTVTEEDNSERAYPHGENRRYYRSDQAEGGMASFRWQRARIAAPDALCRLDFTHLAGAQEQTADALLQGELSLKPHKTVAIELPPDWSANPLKDENWQFQFHSLRWVRCLKAEYDRTHEAKYLHRYLEIIEDWCSSNRYGDETATFAWNDHATAWRARVIALAAESLGSKLPGWLTNSLKAHRDVLLDPAFYVQNGNHALNQNAGLYCVSQVLGDRCSQTAIERTETLIRRSVDLEGVSNEQSLEYHRYNYRRYVEIRELFAANEDWLDPLFDRIAKMPDILDWARLPDGGLVMVGDSHMPSISTSPSTQEVSTSLETAGLTEFEARSRALSRVFGNGYAFARNGTGPTEDSGGHLTVRFGPARTLHGHHDGGAFSFFIAGHRAIEGAGKYGFQQDEFRQYVQSRRAQNVLTFSGHGTKFRPQGETDVLEHVEAGTHFVISLFDNHYEGVCWIRHLVWIRASGTLVVVDEFESTVGSVMAEHRVRLHPDFLAEIPEAPSSVTRSGPAPVFARSPTGFGLRLVHHHRVASLTVARGNDEPLDGWISRRYGKMEPASVILATNEGHRGTFVTSVERADRPNAMVTANLLRARNLVVDDIELTLTTRK